MLVPDDAFETAEQRMRQPGNWVVGGIETRCFWPKRPQLIVFEEMEFLLQPTVGDQQGGVLPAIAIRANSYGLDDAQATAAIMRLATAIAWREGQKVELILWGGGNLPHRLGVLRNNAVTEYFSNDNLHSPKSVEARKALAYYREGLSLDNPFYSFLGFYKAFSRSLPNGRERGPWIQAVLGRLDDVTAQQRRDELVAAGIDISDYVASQGRHAIAHAEREDIVDPDHPDDHRRITRDKPLMRHLAELAMEERLQVPRPETYEREHLYELSGFRGLFDDEQLVGLKQGMLVAGRDYELPNHFHVLARKGQAVAHLGVMRCVGYEMDHGKILLRLEKEGGPSVVLLWLDFINERLIVDPIQGCGLLNQNRKCRADVEAEMELQAFRWCVLCNGSVEIWTADASQRLGKTEHYMPPPNTMQDFRGHQQYMDELTALLAQFPIEP